MCYLTTVNEMPINEDCTQAVLTRFPFHGIVTDHNNIIQHRGNRWRLKICHEFLYSVQPVFEVY